MVNKALFRFTFTIVWLFSSFAHAQVTVQAKAILGGAFDTQSQLMKDDLRVQNVIPFQEPYTNYGYTVTNANVSLNPSLLATNGETAIVDWVLVEVRSENNPTTVVERRAALIQRNGDIVGANGNPLQFDITPGKYHVVIDFKNHLPIMSLRALDGNDNNIVFDSTNVATQVFASDQFSGSKIIGNKRTMRAGDIVPDNVIKYIGADNDRDAILLTLDGCSDTNINMSDSELLILNGKDETANKLIDTKETVSRDEKTALQKEEEIKRDETIISTDDRRIKDDGKDIRGGGGVDPTGTCAGYFRADVNLDGLVKYTGFDNDRDVVLIAIGGVAPNATVIGEMPEFQNDVSTPSSPIPATATVTSPTSIDLSWMPATDIGFGVAGYLISRNGEFLAYVQHPNVSFTDTTVIGGNFYTYDVLSLDYGLNESLLGATTTISAGSAPIPQDDFVSVQAGQSITFDVTSNDDLQGGSVAPSTNPNYGILTNNGNGNFTFQSNPGGANNTSFEYTVTNAIGTNAATVYIEITQIPNEPPIANDDSGFSTPMNTAISIGKASLLSNDDNTDGLPEPMFISQAGNAQNGSIVVNTNDIVFTPNLGFVGQGSFVYTLSDGELTDTALVTIQVQSVNQAPIAVDDNFSGIENQNIVLNTSQLMANDQDPNNDPLNVINVFGAQNGTVSLNGNTITFVPFTGFTGVASFQYTLSDGSLTDTATVYLNIQGSTIAQNCSDQPTTLPNYLSARVSVSMCANVQASPASIQLRWANVANVSRTSISIYRRTFGSTTWSSSPYATPNASLNAWTDTSVQVGQLYEYKVQMTTNASPSTAIGYIASGIQVPATDYEGKIILVVDDAFENSLAMEIFNLEQDFRRSGWIPKTVYVNRLDTAVNVRLQIKSLYDQDPSNTKAVLLLGHVPVPYSGGLNPDGHSDHYAAWVADGYYADMDQSWSLGGASEWGYSHGANNDSKFSPSSFPSALELQVSRLDMYNLPAFGQTETQMLSNYLNKLNLFKVGQFVPQQRARIQDNLEWANAAFSRSAYSTMAPAVDPANITAVYYNTPFISAVNNNTHLWGYGAGGGWIDSADNIGTTQDLVNTNLGSVFNMVMGSYFGDWDTPNNFLRSFLASGNGLTNIWTGGHLFYAHHMAMGKNIGYSWNLSANNSSSNLSPTYGGCCGSGNTYFSLHGDPTLKLFNPKTPSNLQVNAGSGNFTLSWTAPSGGADGYYVYEIIETTGTSNASEAITRIGSKIMTTTSPVISGNPAGRKFMVRAIRDEVTPSGNYENLSLGATN